MNITHCEYREWVPTVHRRIRKHDQTTTNQSKINWKFSWISSNSQVSLFTLYSAGLSPYLWVCLSSTVTLKQLYPPYSHHCKETNSSHLFHKPSLVWLVLLIAKGKEDKLLLMYHYVLRYSIHLTQLCILIFMELVAKWILSF